MTKYYSYGAIPIFDSKILMVCRKDSIGFAEFIKGNYNINMNVDKNYSCIYIEDLFYMMTKDELSFLCKNECTFESAYERLWNRKYIKTTKNKNEKSKFDNKNQWLHLCVRIYNNGKGGWEKPEWGFSKGKKKQTETEIECALRELTEETGISKFNVSSTCEKPLCEIRNEGNKKFVYFYYVMHLNKFDMNDIKIQSREISEIKLVSINEAHKLIRPYFTDRVKILNSLII